jgi:hypothetical protein
MLEKLKARINKVNRVAGLEIVLLPENRYRFNLTVLSVVKQSIIIEKNKIIEVADFSFLKDELENTVPICIVFNGRGILHKKLLEINSDSNYLVQALLPNAKAQDFYVQILPSEKSTLVSIVRREIIDPLLKQIQSLGYYTVDFSLGAVSIVSVLPLVQELTKVNPIQWAEHRVELDSEERLIDYKYQLAEQEAEILLGTDKIAATYLLSYAAAFSFLTFQTPVEGYVDHVKKEKEEFLNKQLFKKLSWTLLIGFLIVLMLNFLFFSSFSTKNNLLAQKESSYSSMLSEMEGLSKQVKEKESFLLEAGWLQTSSMSYFADKIAITVPSSVKLTTFSINPIDERKSKEEKKELFNAGLIAIKGECIRATELNEWMEKVKAIEKVDKVKLVHYSFDRKENKGVFTMEIEIRN